jgi:hypothetical protein
VRHFDKKRADAARVAAALQLQQQPRLKPEAGQEPPQTPARPAA